MEHRLVKPTNSLLQIEVFDVITHDHQRPSLMTELYHVGQCPSCRQGWLILQRNLTNQDIYAHCEECELGFITPDDLVPPLNGFLTVLDKYDFETENPTQEEILRTVWANFIVKEVP